VVAVTHAGGLAGAATFQRFFSLSLLKFDNTDISPATPKMQQS
jgi:hypothetical protein